MFRRMLGALAMFAMALVIMASPAAAEHYTFPSSNDANMTNEWAYVTADTSVPGQATLTFVSTRAFASCFEYRSESSLPTGNPNFNTNAHDLYAYTCVNNSTASVVVPANEYVEVRLVFGAESDEFFDWTRFTVTPAPPADPATKDDCMSGGWEAFGFANQGQCIKYVNTGQDSRP